MCNNDVVLQFPKNYCILYEVEAQENCLLLNKEQRPYPMLCLGIHLNRMLHFVTQVWQDAAPLCSCTETDPYLRTAN
jgi:hypothetical protein